MVTKFICIDKLFKVNDKHTTSMREIRKIGFLSFAKFQSVMGALIGLACGSLYAFGGLLMDTLITLGWVSLAESPGLSVGTLLAFGALLGMPILFAIGGFVFGAIEALLYNIYAKRFGGHKLEFEYQS